MPFACVAEKLFSLFDALKNGEYSDGDFVCIYSFDATYFWGFFALLAMVFLLDARHTIKHGEYQPYFRSKLFWPFIFVLSLEFTSQILDLGGHDRNLCIFLSHVPGINCGQVLGVLVTYAVLSAAMSYYINLYYFPDFLISSRPRSYYRFDATIKYSALDKSTQTEETGPTPARRRTHDILPFRVIGCTGAPRDWWKPSPMEEDLLFRAQRESGPSFESEALQEGIETIASVANDSNTVHVSEVDTVPIEESEIPTPSNTTTSEPPAPIFTTPPVFACCNQIFRTRADYNRHKRYHDKPVTCPHCPRRFGTTKDLERHINDIHERTKVWHCAEGTCKHSRALGGKGFARKENWRRHVRDKHGVDA